MACWKCPQALAALVYQGEPGLAVRKMALLWLPWHVQVLTWKVPGSRPSGCSSPGLGIQSVSYFLCLLFEAMFLTVVQGTAPGLPFLSCCQSQAGGVLLGCPGNPRGQV